ncbi:hypothetical protein B0H13DRAFT_2338506 [Mycena leptocephala]|nr:hypothetical protein B0H13DRAFT_2338506 [Mycena leptocephala]
MARPGGSGRRDGGILMVHDSFDGHHRRCGRVRRDGGMFDGEAHGRSFGGRQREARRDEWDGMQAYRHALEARNKKKLS